MADDSKKLNARNCGPCTSSSNNLGHDQTPCGCSPCNAAQNQTPCGCSPCNAGNSNSNALSGPQNDQTAGYVVDMAASFQNDSIFDEALGRAMAMQISYNSLKSQQNILSIEQQYWNNPAAISGLIRDIGRVDDSVDDCTTHSCPQDCDFLCGCIMYELAWPTIYDGHQDSLQNLAQYGLVLSGLLPYYSYFQAVNEFCSYFKQNLSAFSPTTQATFDEKFQHVIIEPNISLETFAKDFSTALKPIKSCPEEFTYQNYLNGLYNNFAKYMCPPNESNSLYEPVTDISWLKPTSSSRGRHGGTVRTGPSADLVTKANALVSTAKNLCSTWQNSTMDGGKEGIEALIIVYGEYWLAYTILKCGDDPNSCSTSPCKGSIPGKVPPTLSAYSAFLPFLNMVQNQLNDFVIAAKNEIHNLSPEATAWFDQSFNTGTSAGTSIIQLIPKLKPTYPGCPSPYQLLEFTPHVLANYPFTCPAAGADKNLFQICIEAAEKIQS